MDPAAAASKYYMLRLCVQRYSPHDYSLDEVANFLGEDPVVVISYITANELGAEPMGSSYRITVEELEEFLLAKSKGLSTKREKPFQLF